MGKRFRKKTKFREGRDVRRKIKNRIVRCRKKYECISSEGRMYKEIERNEMRENCSHKNKYTFIYFTVVLSKAAAFSFVQRDCVTR